MTEQARLSLSHGDYSNALTAFPEKAAKGRNEVLIRLERGVLLQLMGNYDESAREFEAAVSRIREYEDKAVLSAGRTASQVSSLFMNEQVRPYEGEDFEKILVHAYDSLNYLMKGDLEGARVEIRNAYQRQNELSEKHEKALGKAEKEGGETSWQDSFEHADKGRYEDFRKKAESAGSVYQNAFAYYLSSLVYELSGQDDEAYIDLKKGIQAAPWSKDIQRDLLRLATKLRIPEDVEKWQARFGKPEKDYGRGIDIFVIFQIGSSPVKEELSFPIPLSRGGLAFASIPVYRFVPAEAKGGAVLHDGASSETSVLCDIDATASRNLLDEFPILFAKQVARSYIKARMTNRLSKEYGAAGAITGTIAGLVTERADLRTWSALPKEIQVARVYVPEHTQQVALRSIPGNREEVVDIPEGTRHLIILCRDTGTGLSLQTKAYKTGGA